MRLNADCKKFFKKSLFYVLHNSKIIMNFAPEDGRNTSPHRTSKAPCNHYWGGECRQLGVTLGTAEGL